MSLATELLDYVRAAFSGLYLETLEPAEALRELAMPDGTTLLALVHFHRFLNSPEIEQALWQQLQLGKTPRTFVVLLAPTVTLPPELERSFVEVTRAPLAQPTRPHRPRTRP